MSENKRYIVIKEDRAEWFNRLELAQWQSINEGGGVYELGPKIETANYIALKNWIEGNPLKHGYAIDGEHCAYNWWRGPCDCGLDNALKEAQI